MDVVNLSLSTSRGEWYGTFHELVDLAYFRRCVVVSAMNNLRMPTFPSEFASVVSVAAHSGTNAERFEYNPDGPAEFGAPGIDVEVAWSGGGTLEVTGNSFAAPHIAGMVARIMQSEHGQVLEAESISAGLDYPGVGPEHSHLATIGRARYEPVTDAEVVEAFRVLSHTEGIIPALEPAHAIAWVLRAAPEMQGATVLVNLSGRGDKDVAQMMDLLG